MDDFNLQIYENEGLKKENKYLKNKINNILFHHRIQSQLLHRHPLKKIIIYIN